MANKESYLGELEHIVLLAILKLKDGAYGATVRELLISSINREISIGALYATTDRLERKGLITSRKGEATAERGGKAKRYFTVTSLGLENLTQTRQTFEVLWSGTEVTG